MMIDLQVLIWDSRLSGACPQIDLRAHMAVPMCQVQVSEDGHVMMAGSQNGQVGTILSCRIL